MKNIRFLIIVVLLLFFCVIIYKNNTHDNLSEDSLAFYIDDELSNTMPGKNDGYDFDHAVCTNGASITWDSSTWSPKVNGLVASRTKCTLYFSTSLSSVTLAALNNLNNGYVVTPTTADNPDFSVIAPRAANVNNDGKAEQTSGLFESVDDYGVSYYFRGDINYNYVKFGKWQTDYYVGSPAAYGYEGYNSLSACQSAVGSSSCDKYASTGDDMYWRIIRINGDGSIRMIYDGTSAHGLNDFEYDTSYGNISLANVRSIGWVNYNLNRGDNAYIGYMYGTVGSSTYDATHTNTNDSKIKQRLDSWYSSQMTGYSSYIADAIFCNDRSLISGDGFGNGLSIYGMGQRKEDEQTNHLGNRATLRCFNKNDRFTVSDTTNGNGALTYPVGLITGDEIDMAGGIYAMLNVNYYLLSGIDYWTMTPLYSGGSYGVSTLLYFSADGQFFDVESDTPNVVVRPVINLKADAITGGNGTAQNPFVVQ